MFFGIVTTPNRVLAVSRLPAAFQVELSSSHSSTELSRSDDDDPASANVVSPPPLLIVARLKNLLGVAMSPPVEMVRVVMSSTNVLCRTLPPLLPPARITLLPIFAQPGSSLLVLSVGHKVESLQPSSLVGPAIAASNSWILSPLMVKNFVGETGTAQKEVMA